MSETEKVVIKHPRWRVNGYEALSNRSKQMLWSGIQQVVDSLPNEWRTKVRDVELCGSYVFGNADLGSDLDFCLVMDERFVRKAYDSLTGMAKHQLAPAYADMTNQVSAELGIRLDIAPGISNKDNGVPCVRKSDGRFYNKTPGRVLDNVKYRYNPSTSRFEETIKPARNVQLAEDPWNP
jgi:hypothetical protein